MRQRPIADGTGQCALKLSLSKDCLGGPGLGDQPVCRTTADRQDWMHLLTQYMHPQSHRTAPAMERPRGLRIFAEGISLHAGVSVTELDGQTKAPAQSPLANPHPLWTQPIGALTLASTKFLQAGPAKLASAPHKRLSSGSQQIPCHRPIHRPIRE